MEVLFVALIVVLAALYLARRFYRSLKAASGRTPSGSCGCCDCSGCQIADGCSGADLDRH
jgi:hypothetical protein